MNPEIKQCSEKKLIGISSSINKNEHHKIAQLWKQFMTRMRAIIDTDYKEKIAIQVFPKHTNAQNISEYTIWASMDVSNFDAIPKEFELFTIPEGKYAVFIHRGMNASETYQKIMTEWLPNSGYEIDNRPHYQVMGEKYKNGSPDSVEDFYVPIAKKI
ncbi:GyrI-like domain-containing protein [Winogradskyella bathintestinalis]|uniref:GyrI-like domain-containing protein n=1 Tax=Winogradskyella bathintestinalis TaxID=3035208 RepID=A0ABT7ZVR2_9FLAO|nr:GyrI-like domain-containing protein [Winogradskyella bathintestinalis]MDN3493107.1 GyrI-like domain-containing protein [Winogradskyella bathintestinalis]